jgi:hypothetical protein
MILKSINAPPYDAIDGLNAYPDAACNYLFLRLQLHKKYLQKEELKSFQILLFPDPPNMMPDQTWTNEFFSCTQLP